MSIEFKLTWTLNSYLIYSRCNSITWINKEYELNKIGNRNRPVFKSTKSKSFEEEKVRLRRSLCGLST